MESVLFLYFIWILTILPGSSAQLVADEVAALKVIATAIGKKDWDFSKDPCSGEGNWTTPTSADNVTCVCSFESRKICHVTSIMLKSQNLIGDVPAEFSKLRFLQKLDLSRNLLSGGIPLEWANMNLSFLSFMGNRLSGSFPIALTRITNLTYLSLEGNQFSGSVPPEIGHLVNLKTLHLLSNSFTGKLPEELKNMTSLVDLRLSGNNFTGKIPEFIGSFTQLDKLYLQGCSLSGPIPSSISSLTILTDLRISDLMGGGSAFPPLEELKSLKRLILRSCSITGVIPLYIGNLPQLKLLDLSFNNLVGVNSDLSSVDRLYLTGNMLTGPMPQWSLGRQAVADRDFSSNNFTLGSSHPEECQQGNTNLVESFSSANSFSQLGDNVACLKQGFSCPPRKRKNYRLYINCGGGTVTTNVTYESDKQAGGASMFYASSGGNWAFSNTGNFMESDSSAGYIVENVTTILNLKSSELQLYQTARTSPISLTYYGLCLGSGSYSVKLHFAEIVFTNDSTFSSLGKRMFNVYLQGNLVLKDFDIAAEAGGPGKPITRSFTVYITNNTLKIHLYWAGKGTTGIPQRGTYGPLISAITVDPNFTPPIEPQEFTHARGERQGLVAAMVSGITIGVVSILALMTLAVLHKTGHIANKRPAELSGVDLKTGRFTLRQIRAATKNFDASFKIGEGGFGSVYKGLLSDGTIIAVKQLSAKSKQGIREFINEIGMISALQHPNLVKLYGCCAEGSQMLLVYEYMENNCLARALFGRDTIIKDKLDWKTRLKISVGIAKGLVYLHEESGLKILHRDIKASNVLLDKGLNAKISDFGLAKLDEGDKSHITTRIAGTVGYMAPEYAMRGYLTPKADVYSFGIVLLELVSGKSNTTFMSNEETIYLLDWAYVLQERGSLLDLVDPDLQCEYSSKEALLLLNVALICCNASPSLRPDMSQVVSMLEGRIDIQEIVSEPGFSLAYYKPKVVTHFWQHRVSSHEASVVTTSDAPSPVLADTEVKAN